MMRRLVSLVLVVLIVVPIFVVFTPTARASENVIFQDNFESYAVGTFPSSGGWSVVWNGAGNQYQVVTSSYSASPTKSLQLMGSYGWSVVVKKDFSSSSNIIGYEAYMMTSPGGGGDVAFCNIPIETWGRYYAMVGFGTDGYIWACEKNNEGVHQLQAFTPFTWYKIMVLVDRAAKLYNVWINDVLKGQNIPIYYDPYEILSLQFQVGWVSIKNYFDDVKVFEEGTPPPTSPVISSVSEITATRLQTIHIYGSGFGNVWPQTVSLGDGSVDTVKSSTTPSMAVGDTGAGSDAWAAGYTDYSTVFCAIGIILVSWSDNEIVLDGFGTALGTDGQGTWNIAPGDPMYVQVWTPSGYTIFHTAVAGTPPQEGSISGVVFYLDSEGNVVPIEGATVSLTYTSTATTTDAQGRYVLQHISYGSHMMSSVVAGCPERNEYAEISEANPNSNVHFCMKAQILDDLTGSAVTALNDIDSWLQTVAQHIDNFAAQYQLQVGEALLEQGLSLVLDGSGWSEHLPLPPATSAIIDEIVNEYVAKNLAPSITTPLASIINQYHLNEIYGLHLVRYEDWFNTARQYVAQSFRPLDSAALFKYPRPIDPEMKAYIQDMSDHFQKISTIYEMGSEFIDAAIKKIEGVQGVAWEFFEIGSVLAGVGFASIPLTTWVGATVGAVGAVTAAASMTIVTGAFVEGYSKFLIPDYVRFAEEAASTITHIEDSLSDAFTKAGNKNLDPSIGILGIQVVSGGSPSFTIRNPSGSDVSVDAFCIAELDFPELVGRVATPFFFYTFEEPAFSLSSGTERVFNMYYPASVVSWIDYVRTQITGPTELRIELTVCADYGTNHEAEYSTRKQTTIWTAQEYPVDYDEFQLHSSCDLHIFDLNGNHIGINYTTGEMECEIPDSYYVINETQQIIMLNPAGRYVISLMGTGNGDYHLDIKRVVAGVIASDQWVNGTIGNGQRVDYHVFVGSSAVPIVDDTPPTTEIQFGNPCNFADEQFFVNASTPILLNSTDNADGSGVLSTAYRIFNGTYDSGWLDYAGAFGLSSLRDGNYTVAFNSTDNAGNVEDTNYVGVMVVGPDMDGNGSVDILDAVKASKAFGSHIGSSEWNPVADINFDGKVDILDLILLSRMFGKQYP